MPGKKMGKFSAACFIVLALFLIAGELMVAPSVAKQGCLEGLPWVRYYCEDGNPSRACWGNCTQRHPNLITAFCGGAQYLQACMCEYQC